MKNLMITTAIFLLMISAMEGWLSLYQVIGDKSQLKSVADEAAAAAALCIDENSFGEGILQWNEESAAKEAEAMIEENLLGKLSSEEEEVKWQIFFSEDENAPSVRVILRWGKLKEESTYEYLSLRAAN